MTRLFLLALLFAPTVEAKPHPRLKHTAELLYNFAVPAGTAILATHEISNCRKEFGIGPCPQGGYGAYKTRQALTIGLSIGEGTLSHFWHRSCDCKESFLPSTGMIIFNTATAIAAATHKGPHETD